MISTPRVLHLVTPAAAGCGAAMLRLIGATRALLPEQRHELMILGPASWSRTAKLVGAGPHRRIPPLLGSPRLTARSIRSAIEAIGADIVHAWDATSVDIVIGDRQCGAVAATLAAVPPRRGSTPLALDRVEAICLGERARREAIGAGWLHARIRAVSPPGAIAPRGGAAASTPRHDGPDRRSSLRAEWMVDDDTPVVALVADPIGAADPWLAYEMAARASIAGHRVRLLCAPETARVEEFARWGALSQLERMVIVDERTERAWEVADGLDAALLAERRTAGRGDGGDRASANATRELRSGPLSMLWLRAAGVPAIVTRNGPLDGFVDPADFTTIDARPNAGAVALSALRPRRSGAVPATGTLGCDCDEWSRTIRDLYARAAATAGGAERARSERAASV